MSQEKTEWGKGRSAAELQTVLKVFHREGASDIWVQEHCGRIYVGRAKAGVCRTCGEVPDNFILT